MPAASTRAAVWLLWVCAHAHGAGGSDCGAGIGGCRAAGRPAEEEAVSALLQVQRLHGRVPVQLAGDPIDDASWPGPAQDLTPPGDNNTMVKVDLVAATGDIDATCNDGSPAVLYWSAAPSWGERNSWLVYLNGGWWCWDKETCAARQASSPSLWSSRSYSDVVSDTNGILGPDSPLRGYNRALLPQCSSDAWTADIGPQENDAGVNWRGARIVRAALRYITETHGLRSGDFLVLGGGSAGARGAMVHLDRLTAEGLVPDGVEVFGFLDSPLWMSLPPFRNMTGADADLVLETKLIVQNSRSASIVSGGGLCQLDEAWKCAFAEYRLPLLRTPFFIAASQYDWFGLTRALQSQITDTKCFPSPQSAYYGFAQGFAKHTRDILLGLPQAANGVSGVYSSTCYDHAVSRGSEFSRQKVLDVSMSEALQQAITAFRITKTGQQAGLPMPLIVDTSCQTLNCGSGCLRRLPANCVPQP